MVKATYSSKNSIRWFFYLLISSGLSLLLMGCDKTWRGSWQDEVKLHSGQSIWVKRTVEYTRNGRDYITKEGGNITSMTVKIEVPENSIAPPPPIWSFNAVPLLLDYDTKKKTWFIVASFFYCDSWEEAGKPALEQWQYEVENDQWIIKPLDTKLVGRMTNLMISFTKGNKLKRASAEDIYKEAFHRPPGDIYSKIALRKQTCNQSRNFKPGF